MTRLCAGCGENLPADTSKLEVRQAGDGLGLQMSNCYCEAMCWDLAEMRYEVLTAWKRCEDQSVRPMMEGNGGTHGNPQLQNLPGSADA